MKYTFAGHTWFQIISATNLQFCHLYTIVAAFLASLSLEKENIAFTHYLEISYLRQIVERLVNKLTPENCRRSVEELIKLLPGYELELDSNTKVYLSFQAHLFHYKTGTFLMSIPQVFDPTLRQIYLASDVPACESKILYYVPSLKSYSQKFGNFCFFCKKHFSSRGCNHKCSKIVSCFCCKRPFQQANTFLTKENKASFCNSRLLPSPSQKCNICNVIYFSQECFTEHIKKVCRWGWKCPKCNIFQGRNGFFKNQEEIKAKHVCEKRYCNYCGQLKEAQHFCSLKEHKPQNELTNLAFVSFSYSGFNIAKCRDCYLKNDGHPCPKCPENLEAPVSCIILQETENRDSFTSFILVDKTMRKNSHVEKSETLNYKYIPMFVDEKPKLAPEGRKTRFGQRQKKTKCLDMFNKPKMTLMDQFFDFLLKNKFSNSTIFVYSGLSKDMFFILQALVDNGLSPNIVKVHNQIMLIEEKTLSLRFVEVQNYLHCSFRELCERIKKPMPFFPLKWIQKSFFDYIGKPPVLDDLFDFEDTEKDIAEKNFFLSKTKSEWHFMTEYFTFLTHKIQIIATAMLEFFLEAFFCQLVIVRHFKHLENQWTFMHPANPPIFTAATYSFQMFLQLSKQANTIKTILPPIPFKSSKGEIEYVMYLMWKYPNLNFNMAWSPYGQTNLKYTKPDAICGNEVWYYNGCFYHGHSKEECKFKSKVAEEVRKAKELDFAQKIDKLKKERPDTKITIMWECTWRELKKVDEEVQYFLKNIFRNPPMFRLDAREAGKKFAKRA